MEEQNTEVIEVKERRELVSGNDMRPIIPLTYQDAQDMAIGFCKAGIIPRGLEAKDDNAKTLGMVTTAIMQGLEVGMPPIAAISNIMVVNGRPCVWGDGAVALIQASGLVVYFKEWIEGEQGQDNWTAYTEIMRKGQEQPYRGQFSWLQAKKAKLIGKPGPWLTYPDRMLQMRARAFAARDGFSDVLKGLAIVEEARDVPIETEIVNTDFLDE